MTTIEELLNEIEFLLRSGGRENRLAVWWSRTAAKIIRHYAQILRAIHSGGEKAVLSYLKGHSPVLLTGEILESSVDEWTNYISMILKKKKADDELDKKIALILLSSPQGITLLLEREFQNFWDVFKQIPSPEIQVLQNELREKLSSIQICPGSRCGKMFVSKGKRIFCSEACRKRAHDVPSSKRSDQTPRMYFYRKIKAGLSREKAWEATRERHGKSLEHLGLSGSKPPTSWAKKGG